MLAEIRPRHDLGLEAYPNYSDAGGAPEKFLERIGHANRVRWPRKGDRGRAS